MKIPVHNIFSITVTLVLLVVTTGFTVSTHYCGDTVISKSLNDTPESCCGAMETSECCQVESEFVKLDVSFLASLSDIPAPVMRYDIIPVIVSGELATDIFRTLNDTFVETGAPPGRHSQTLSLFQVFLC